MDRASFMVSVTALAWLGSLGACGNGGSNLDSSVPDVPPGPCGADQLFTGELVDWDATEADFCGLFNSRVALRGTQSPSDTTGPNGRFELCVPRQAQGLVDATHSTAASPCVGVTGSYPVRGVLVAQQALIERDASFSARAMTQPRQDEMFTQIGQAYDAAKAHLVVHVVGAPRAVTISANHAAVQRFDGTTWVAGNTGSDVFFPNVDPGSVQITVAGGAVGVGAVMLEAGAYTYVTVATN
jgi:hypothetical protein